ncbi:MAG: penicillin-binding protein [Candidatus Dormibacteraeota bacterium]|nr:penicillin-binding protein [Candidatus Dormibacteraeota bacterium]
MRQRQSRRAPQIAPTASPAPAARRRPGAGRWLRRLLVAGLAGSLASLVGAGTFLYSYAGEMPSLSNLSAQHLPQTTRIYARDGKTLLEERYQQRRTVVPLDQVAWDLRHATIAIEDRDFYNHGAISPLRIVAAGFYDVLHRNAAQGGSTITQQLVKNYLLQDSAQSRSLDRKARELVLAVELEREYSKDQILGMYLNTIFYGNQAFGIEAAAQTYFGVPAARLDLAQASFLAGLPQRPSYFNPFLATGYAEARARQHDVLNAMVRDSYITAAVADRANAEDLRPALTTASQAAGGRRSSIAPHFVDYVWSELERRYDPNYLRSGGLRIVTTLDPHSQALAEQAVTSGVAHFAKSNGVNNGAMLVMDPHTGEVLAMVGSADYFNSGIGGQVNYTVSPRQPGSSFKPYTYVTALMNGWTPASPLDDSHGATAFAGYPVHDWDGKELGTITLRQSLQQSRNISSVHLFKDVGVDKVFTVAKGLGISTPLDPTLPTTLGASELRMIDHLSAYSSFANGGHRVRPATVLEIRDGQGAVLESNRPPRDAGERVLPAAASYMLTDILKGAVRPGLSIPAAAKSGTTTDFKDAWYVGYTSDLAVASWMGRTVTLPTPRNESMNGLWGEVGPSMAWRQFVKAYYAGRKPADWTRPADVVSTRLCKLTGQPAAQIPAELTVTDLSIKSDATPTASCGAGGPSGSGQPGSIIPGLPGLPTLPTLPPLPSLPPLPLPSLP